jgi:hypothetical protein
VARFYGFSDIEISRMPYKRFYDYLKAIEILRAREALLNISVTNYADMKATDQTKTIRELKKSANNFAKNETPLADWSAIVKKMKGS